MKKKNEVIVLVVLVVVAGLVWAFEWNRETPAVQMANSIESYKFLAEEDPQVRSWEVDRARKTEYKSNGRNPFSVIAPPPPGSPDKNKPDPTHPTQPTFTPPPPPTVATLPPNMKFFGYGTIPVGSTRRAFFSDGDSVYIVLEGETLLGRYRILKVGNTNIEFQEISSGLHGTAPLDEQAVSPSA